MNPNIKSPGVISCMLIVLLSATSFAQEKSPADTPKSAAEAYCKAVSTGNEPMLLAIINEESGKQLGEMVMQYLKELHKLGDTTLSSELFGRALADEEVEALTWKSSLARYLCGPATNHQRRRSPGTWSLNPNWLGGISAPGSRKVLGVVKEDLKSDDDGWTEMAHVVYRYEGMNPRPFEDFVNLLTCIKKDDRWQIGLPWRMTLSFMERAETLKMMRNNAMQRSGGVHVSDTSEPTPAAR